MDINMMMEKWDIYEMDDKHIQAVKHCRITNSS